MTFVMFLYDICHVLVMIGLFNFYTCYFFKYFRIKVWQSFE